VKFYQKVFGWKIEKWGSMDYWLAITGPDSQPGINGAIMTRETQKTTVNTINVSSVDESAKKILDAGGKILTPKTPKGTSSGSWRTTPKPAKSVGTYREESALA
jgi:hypothetical protein